MQAIPRIKKGRIHKPSMGNAASTVGIPLFDGGLVYLTEHGAQRAGEFERYRPCIKDKLFVRAAVDETADIGICALISELSEDCLSAVLLPHTLREPQKLI